MPIGVNIAVFPNYEDVFDDGYKEKSLIFYLKDIPTYNLISSISFISACLDTGLENFEAQNYILKELITPLARKEQIEISAKINSFEGGTKKIIFNHFACLLIAQTAILNFNLGEKVNNLSRDNARNILKAFLWCNSKYSKGMTALIPKLNLEKDREKVCGLFISMDVAQSGFFSNKKDILEQSFKLKIFDEFLKNDIEIGKYYQDFIESKHVSNLLDIIRIIWNTYFKILQPEKVFNASKIKNAFNFNENHFDVKEYFNSMSIHPSENQDFTKQFYIEDLDFKLIREKPIYKLEENIFNVLSVGFFVDKIFNSLLFDYYIFINSKGYSGSFGDFKSYYSEVFVEKYLLRLLLDVIFEKIKADVKQPGDIGKKQDRFNKDYSDYYLRKGDKIILFECKDAIMRADVKYSYDHKKVFQDIDKKFITKVGVDQFIKVINSISNNDFQFDKIEPADFEKLTIIPVIVYTDISFNARAVNYYLNTVFKKKISELNFKCKIEPIVMIHIDSLIDYHELFRDKVDFINTLERYNRYISKNEKKSIKTSKHEINCFEDYNTFLKRYIHKEREFTHKDINVYNNLYKDLYESN